MHCNKSTAVRETETVSLGLGCLKFYFASLVSCPVQSTSCECSLKDFALLHTKTRNMLKPKTVQKLTQTNQDLERKYSEEQEQYRHTSINESK
jgi:hypothetical protein